MNAISTNSTVREKIRENLKNTLNKTDLLPNKLKGKVRDIYDLGDKYILITTDRQSAFDRVLAHVPFKGQVLNQTSAWWFEKTKHIIDNHVLSVPDPSVTVAKKCSVLPIEFVVRGYITGSTSTSLWTVYKNGSRNYCGVVFPDGLVKNQRLETPVLTPTTKEVDHDRPISPEEIVGEGWLTREEWETASVKALELFTFGQKVAEEHGLILVDTKYEFGRDEEGNIILIDEIHTPDSSRYWIKKGYRERIRRGLEPENIDKEFLRLWFVDNCDPYNDPELPEAPEDLVVELSTRYIYLFETITNSKFIFPEKNISAIERVKQNLAKYL